MFECHEDRTPRAPRVYQAPTRRRITQGSNADAATPQAIARSPLLTSPSVPIAVAPCGGSQSCHAPATLSHSLVTRHDVPTDAHRDRARSGSYRQRCLHRQAGDRRRPSAIGLEFCRGSAPWQRLVQSGFYEVAIILSAQRLHCATRPHRTLKILIGLSGAVRITRATDAWFGRTLLPICLWICVIRG